MDNSKKMISTINTPVWFITGCSTGFGHELAQQAIAKGLQVVVTARDKSRVANLIKGHENRALALSLDVASTEQINAAVIAAEDKFGRIDVLVNNAGYGYMSSVEEGQEAEIRAQFDANVFGLFAMTRAVLPGMRAQRSGHVINVTSVAGHVGFPGSGYYAASKHAVEGWSDALAAEGEPLGIKVSCIAPGPSRTDWAGRSMMKTPNLIDDYAQTVGTRLSDTSAISGQQAGDPVRIAQAMIAMTEAKTPPRHFVLGSFGVEAVTRKLIASLTEVEAWRAKGMATDYPSA